MLAATPTVPSPLRGVDATAAEPQIFSLPVYLPGTGELRVGVGSDWGQNDRSYGRSQLVEG